MPANPNLPLRSSPSLHTFLSSFFVFDLAFLGSGLTRPLTAMTLRLGLAALSFVFAFLGLSFAAAILRCTLFAGFGLVVA